VFERLKARLALLRMSPTYDPPVPPLPIESVPALTVVLPVNVLVPVRNSVFVLSFVSEPAPEMARA
jgi:hypothetical protein